MSHLRKLGHFDFLFIVNRLHLLYLAPQVFALYDTDNNGKLQYAEMNSFMKDLLMRIERSKKSFKKGLTEKEMFKYSQDVANLIQKLVLLFYRSILLTIFLCLQVNLSPIFTILIH